MPESSASEGVPLCPLPNSPAEATRCAELRLQQQSERATLLQIARILSEPTGEESILQAVVDILESRMGLRNVTVMLLSSEGDRLYIEAARVDHLSARTGTAYARGEGIIGEVLRTGQPFIVPRIADEPRFQNRLYARSHSELARLGFICVPVVVDGEAAGTLSADVCLMQQIEPGALAEFLSIVAAMLAYHVKSRRLQRLERESLARENLRLRDALGENLAPANMIGSSGPMREVYQRIHQVAPTDTTVLIRGESGTGKELVATAIHQGSPRAGKRFIRLNCAALNDNLFESELFGHERGAFTGAVKRRIGRIEEAEGGTLFLDEIGDFSPAIQVKLLRVLQEREYERVGSNETRRCDIRIIAATNRNLEELVQQGRFRQDLYYRINVFPIHLPPLRHRRGDILPLANHFIARYSQRMGRPIHRLTTPAIDALLLYHWPGNVRELENCIEHAVLLATDGVICGYHLPPTLQLPDTSREASPESLQARVEALERDLISDALKRTRNNMAAAARELKVTPRVLRYKVRKLGLLREDGGSP